MKRNHDPILISQAGPAFHAFIRNLFKGIQAYFPIPDTITRAQIQAIAYWKEFDADRRKLERIWEPRFEKLLRESGDQVAQAYKETQQTTAAIRVVNGRMMPALEKMMQAAVLETEREFLKRLRQSLVVRKADDWDEVDPLDIPEMVDWNRSTMGAKISKIAESTRDAIRGVIDQGLKDGASIFDIVGRLSSDFSFSRYRAYLIARTEIISASNAATHFGIGRNVPKKGMKKTWLATGDRRTRPTHMRAGASQKDVPYEEPFVVGGALLMFPGDGSLGAPAKEIVQCRCTSLYSVPDLPTGPPPALPDTTPPPSLPKLPPSPKPKPKPKPRKPKKPADIADPVKRAKALREEVELESKALLDELAPLAARRQELLNKLVQKNGNWTFPNPSDFAEWQRVTDRLGALNRELTRILESKFLQAGGTRQQFALAFQGSVEPFIQSRARYAADFLEKWVESFRPDAMPITVNQIAGRANAKPWLNGIYMDLNDPVQVYVHEIGHILEDRIPDLKDAIQKLYRKRTAADVPESLRTLTGSNFYEPTEMTRKDKWADPYMGRVYNGQVYTELVSMAVQQLYENPGALLKDGELFDVVMGHLRFRKVKKP